MDKNYLRKGDAGDTKVPQKQRTIDSLQEGTSFAANNRHPESGAGDGPAYAMDLCEGLSQCSTSDGDCCQRAYRACKYNKEGKKRHSSGNSKEAFKMFEKAAECGSSSALFNLGMCYELGTGCEKDSSKAAVKYAQACEKRHKHAAFNLGMMNINGYCEMDPNLDEGLKYLKKAAEWGLGKAATELGVVAVQREPANWREAVKWFKQAANGEDEDLIGVLFLAHCYHYGHGLAVNQPEGEATSLYEKAAKGLHKLCQKKCLCEWQLFALGLCYEHGWGLTRDLVQAREYYEKSQLPQAQTRIEQLEDSSVESEEDDLSDLMKLVDFRPTVAMDDTSAVMKKLVEMRSNGGTEEEDDSWGSYSGGKCGGLTKSEGGDSSGESVSNNKTHRHAPASSTQEVSSDSVVFEI